MDLLIHIKFLGRETNNQARIMEGLMERGKLYIIRGILKIISQRVFQTFKFFSKENNDPSWDPKG